MVSVSSGMHHQLVIWTALENEGFGASLQHYTELIEADVRKRMGYTRKLEDDCTNASLVKPTGEPGEKSSNHWKNVLGYLNRFILVNYKTDCKRDYGINRVYEKNFKITITTASYDKT